MRPDRLGFRPAQIRVFIHGIRYKREREYIICYHTNEAGTVREAKRPSETGNHLIVQYMLWRPPSHRLGGKTGLHEYITLYMTLVGESAVLLVWNSEHATDPCNTQPLRAGAFPRAPSGPSHPGDALGVQLQSISGVERFPVSTSYEYWRPR